MPDESQKVAAEITRLHDFFTNWFAGRIPNDDGQFQREVGRSLVPEFVNIQPAGTMLARDYLLGQIKSGYGRNKAFQIDVEKVNIHQHLPGGILLVTYEEHQKGAMNSTLENGRLSTALLRKAGGQFEWLWVHETALPVPDTTPVISAI